MSGRLRKTNTTSQIGMSRSNLVTNMNAESPIAVLQDFPETVAMHGDLHLIISNCMTSVPFWKAVVCSCCKSLPTNSKKHASFYLFVQQVLFSGCRSNVDLEKVWTQRLS